jgi:hypothetical protein
MQSIPYFIIALILATILWRLGWRPYTENAANLLPAAEWTVGLSAGEFRLIGFGFGRRFSARRGGYEGGRVYLVLFGLVIGLWRDPYRSANSGDYMVDKT